MTDKCRTSSLSVFSGTKCGDLAGDSFSAALFPFTRCSLCLESSSPLSRDAFGPLSYISDMSPTSSPRSAAFGYSLLLQHNISEMHALFEHRMIQGIRERRKRPEKRAIRESYE
jgi:hypothetical protein